MAVTGRKPIPHALKLVNGDEGKRGKAAAPKVDPPIVPPARPSAPAHLTEVGRAEWRRVVGLLSDAGLMTSIDRAVLAAYCDAYGDWIEARGVLVALGAGQELAPSIMTERGRQARRAVRDARVDMLRFAVEFGMTPSARSRIDVGIATPPGGDEGDEGGAPEGTPAASAEPASKASRYFP